MASMQPESGRIIYPGSNFPHPFQFHFSKEGKDHIVQNRPGSSLDGLGQCLAKPTSGGLESSRRCAGFMSGPVSGRTQPARYQSVSVSLSDSDLANCARFWPRIRSGTKLMYKNHPARFWPMVSSRSGPDANRIWHVYWEVYEFFYNSKITDTCQVENKHHA